MPRISAALFCLLLVLTAPPSGATPFFARTYNMSCQACHSGFPRLNEFGMAFKANNFRIPGAEKDAPLAWQKTIPLAVQVKPQYQRFNPGSRKSQITDTQILGGGLLTRGTAFYIRHSYFYDAKPNPFPTWEAWVQQVLNERGSLMLKAGQFELPLAYSPDINRTTLSSPVALFSGLHGSDVPIGAPMSGLQMSGIVPGGMRWYVAGGAPSHNWPSTLIGERQFFGRFRDVFARLAWGPLEKQVGVLAYATHAPRNRTDPTTEDRGVRYGVDGTFTWQGFQFQGMVVYGENANPAGTGAKGVLRSGFIEVDRMIKPWLGVTGRLEGLETTVGTTRRYLDAKTIAVRGYPYPLLKLEVEHQWLDHGRTGLYFLAAVSF